MVMLAFYGKKMTGDSFNVQYNDGNARAAIIKTFHGKIETPVFMPVGTLGSVKAVFPNDLNKLKIDIILANPPYLRSSDPHLNSLQWEPENALVSGDTGIECFKEIFSQSKSLLKKEGFLTRDSRKVERKKVGLRKARKRPQYSKR